MPWIVKRPHLSPSMLLFCFRHGTWWRRIFWGSVFFFQTNLQSRWLMLIHAHTRFLWIQSSNDRLSTCLNPGDVDGYSLAAYGFTVVYWRVYANAWIHHSDSFWSTSVAGQEELTSVQKEQQILTDASRAEPFTVKYGVWWQVWQYNPWKSRNWRWRSCLI